MAKVCCCKCGSGNLRDEYFFFACNDCGSVTYTIPGDALVDLENPVAPDDVNPVVTLRFDRTKLARPGLSISGEDGKGVPCNRQRAREMARCTGR